MAGLAGIASGDLPRDLNGENIWGTIIGTKPTNRTELPLNVAINRDLTQTSIPNLLQRHPFATNYSSLIQWPWKLIIGVTYLAAGQQETVTRAGWWTIEDYKYYAPSDLDPEGVMLFNLESDEAERNNIA